MDEKTYKYMSKRTQRYESVKGELTKLANLMEAIKEHDTTQSMHIVFSRKNSRSNKISVPGIKPVVRIKQKILEAIEEEMNRLKNELEEI